MSKRESDPAKGLNAAVAAVLNGERSAAGMTFEQLADASGISARTLQRLIKRERHIDVEVLDTLARVFGLTSAEVVVAAEERMRRVRTLEAEARAAEVPMIPGMDAAAQLAAMEEQDYSLAAREDRTGRPSLGQQRRRALDAIGEESQDVD